MNIVFLAPFGYSPKATVSARMFPMASALARRNHRVTILMPPYDNPADSGRTWQEGEVQFENMHLPADETQATSGKRMISLAWQMAMRTRQLGSEVIHVFKP